MARFDLSSRARKSRAAVEAGLAEELEVFLRRSGPTDWRERIGEVSPIHDAGLVGVLGAAAAIEFDAFYMRRKLRASGVLRSRAVDAYTAVWLVEETDHGRCFEALVERLSGGTTQAQSPEHGTFSRDPRAIAAIPALWVGGVAWRATLAGYFVRGALVELTAITIYRALTRELKRAGELAGSQIVGSITSQEGRHLRFFTQGAHLVLSDSPGVEATVRWATERTWRPPGVDLYGRRQWSNLFGPVLSTPGVMSDLLAIDAKVSMLPGFAGSTIVKDFVEGIVAETGQIKVL